MTEDDSKSKRDKYNSSRFYNDSTINVEKIAKLEENIEKYYKSILKEKNILVIEYKQVMASHSLTIGKAIVDDYWKEVSVYKPEDIDKQDQVKESSFIQVRESNTVEEKEELIAEIAEEFIRQDTGGDMIYSLLLHSLLHNFNRYVPETVLEDYTLEVEKLRQVIRKHKPTESKSLYKCKKSVLMDCTGYTKHGVEKLIGKSLAILRTYDIIKAGI